MYKRVLAVVLCFALVISILPVISFADNSGFIQIRVFYKIRLANGNYGEEASALVTEGSYLQLPVYAPYNQVLITRFQIQNLSSTLGYYQFDICAGGQVPLTGGTYPSIYCSGWDYTNSSSITAFTLPAMDEEDFTYISGAISSSGPSYTTINCSFNRTFFGKTNRSGFINFTSPHMQLMLNANSSPSSSYMWIFFRNIITGIDSSSYLSNMEKYLSNIDSNVDKITDWMDEEHEQYQSAWNNGAGSTYDEYSSDNGTFFGNILGILGLRIFSWHWDLNIFNASNNFFSSWFSQTNSDNINGTSKKAIDETEYIDYYSRNQSGDLDIFGVDSND